MDFWHDLANAYTRHILNTGKEGQFVVLTTFLLTFVVIRIITNAIRRGSKLFRNVWIQGHHVHHLVPGILLLLVSGYLSIALHSRGGVGMVSALFGIGAALTLDEFALWLHLRDVYWEREGRRSIDAVIVASLIGGLILLGTEFWVDLVHVIGRHL
jgi:hypothetical protein